MAGIHVLSDNLKAGNKAEKTPALKEIDSADNPDNAASAFAAMLGGSMNKKADSKGHYSAIVGQGSEKKQSTEDSVQSAQNSNELGSMLGYGNFVFPLLTQPMLQVDLPAGKEANSGNDYEVSAQLGMTAQNIQGDNPEITELDKYRQVIGDLLGALSGQITNTSQKETLSSSDSWGSKDLNQDIVKVVQGWMTLADDKSNIGSALTAQKGIQSLIDVSTIGSSNVKPGLNEKVSTLLKALNPILNQEGKTTDIPQGVKETLKAEVVTDVKDAAVLINPQPKSTEVGLEASKTPKSVQRVFNKELNKVESTSPSEPSAVKVIQNQSTSAGIGVGVLSNNVVSNVAEGKTTAVPVWEQISTVLREQVMNKTQDLKQLDIQLHPADLGKIQIDLRWENGQVNLQVQASHEATGQLLQNHLSDLRQALSNQGVNCGMLQMGQGGAQQQRQQSPQGDESRRTFYQNLHLDQDQDPDLTSVSTSVLMGPVGVNRINVTA
ncbi:MAG: flagellar hook-length control protein FliK [Desulfosporosinus sp.]|nr:flagellar hook-length control protein FliK [Desulfosporosinus sp.]